MTAAARHTHTVLVIDDHALVREGVVSVLRRAAPDATVHDADSLAQARGWAQAPST